MTINQFQSKYDYNLKIMDLLDPTGNIKQRIGLNKSLQSNMSQMFYNSVSSAIPKRWLEILKNRPVANSERWSDDIYLKHKK